MEGLAALKQVASEGLVADRALAEDGAGDGEGLFGVVGSLADAPLVAFAGIAGGLTSAGDAVEAGDAAGIPAEEVGAGKGFGLFADRVADGQRLEAAAHPAGQV